MSSEVSGRYDEKVEVILLRPRVQRNKVVVQRPRAQMNN